MSEYTDGHRKRAKEKYLNNKSSLADYEILELLLMYSIPRIDVKPLAKDLLKHFVTLENVFNARPEQLKLVKGIGENSAILISLFDTILKRLSKNRNENIKQFTNEEDTKKYFKNLLLAEQNEKIAIVSLDNSSKIISCRIISEGTVNLIDVSPRKIIEPVITDNASSVIISHNHPYGDTHPSAQDVNFTIQTKNMLKQFGIELIDHIIVGESSVLSMRSTLPYSHYFS